MDSQFEKLYTNATPYKIVVCIDKDDSKLLKEWSRYYVIDETETQYHIQFPKSLGTKWYAKERFMVPKAPPQLDPALEKRIDDLFGDVPPLPPPCTDPEVIKHINDWLKHM